MRATVPFVLLLAACGAPRPDSFASGLQISRLDQTIGGEKGIARPGDFLLENEHIRVAILGGRNSMGPGLFGGSLVDADLQRDARYGQGRGIDQFNEMFPTANMNLTAAAAEGDVVLVADGRDGGPAIVRARQRTEPFLSVLNLLWGILRAPDMWLSTDYILEPGVPWMTIRTTVSFGLDPDAEGDDIPAEGEEAGYPDDLPVLAWAVESGVAIGDFFLSGGSLDVFGPGIGFDEDGAVYRADKAGLNTFQDPFEFAFLAGTGDGVSYGIAPKQGTLKVPLFTASQTATFAAGRDGVRVGEDVIPGRFPPGTALSYERYFFVGEGDVGSVVDQLIDAQEIPHGRVRGLVTERGTGLPVTKIDVFAYRPGDEYPWSHWQTDVGLDDDTPDGTFGGALPVGDWELLVHERGRPDGSRVPVTVTEGGEVSVQLEAGRSGVLDFSITDETGRAIPAKLSLFRVDAETNRNPALGDGFISGAPETVVYAPTGHGEVALPDGEFVAVASRGTEYEIDRSEPFRIDATRGARIELQVERIVDSLGWVSADLHVHAAPSHDVGVTLEQRVGSMVCEGVEFFTGTDHDHLTDYAPVIEAMGLSEWTATAVGVETTTLELGHFLGFPLEKNYLGDAGGAFDWTGKTAEEILAEIRKQGEDAGYNPFTFVAHPRDGILGYFDQFGFDPYGGEPGSRGEPGEPEVRVPTLALANDLLQTGPSWEFDGLELFTGKRLDQTRVPLAGEVDAFSAGEADEYDWMTRTLAEQQGLADGTFTLAPGLDGNVDDWFSLLNLGFKYTVLGNSDTHGLASGEAGCPRNYVLTSTPDYPDQVDDPAYLDAQAVADAVRRHQVVASYGPLITMTLDGQPIGAEVVTDGEVAIELVVQAPTWMDVDRVELYENGRLIEEFAVPAGGPPDRRFATTVRRRPDRDAWYVAITAGDGDLAPVFTPVEIPYIDLQTVVLGALGGVPALSSFLSEAIPFPREYPLHPYAMTNPIWVDRDGDGFDAPGHPAWWVKPAAE